MKGILKDSFILLVITLIAGVLLGTVYEVTKEPIRKQQEITKSNACKSVFADAVSFEVMDTDKVSGDMAFDGGDIDEILYAFDENGNIKGYVMTVTSHKGYGGDITFLIGIQNDGTVNGISFTSISETAGLGMKAQNEQFKGQFEGKNVESFVYTKSGKSADNEIDAISAATVTTSAVTGSVNGAVHFFRENLMEKDGVANE